MSHLKTIFNEQPEAKFNAKFNSEVDVKMPYIGENKNWWIGDIDTGVKAEGTDGVDGLTPYIGENENWWIGTTDTGVRAEGKNGKDGIDGAGKEGYAMAYTVKGMTFAPETISFADCGISVFNGTYAIVEKDGRNTICVKPTRTASGEVVVIVGGLTSSKIDFSVYNYAEIEYYLDGTRPKGASMFLTFPKGSGNLTTAVGKGLTGWIAPNNWTKTLSVPFDVSAYLDENTEEHIISNIQLKICNGASASSYSENTVMYLSNITFYQYNPNDVVEQNCTFTLDGVEGLEVGDEYSTHVLTYPSFSVQTERAGTILDIDGNVVTVGKMTDNEWVSRNPINIHTFAQIGDGSPENYLTDEGWDSEINTFRIVKKRNVGNRKIGHGSVEGGINCEAHSKGAVAFGEGCIAYGSFSLATGKYCEAEYCSVASGVNCKARGHQSVARGTGCITERSNQIALGSYNKPDLESIVIIGNGTSFANQSNLLRILADGTVEITKEDGTITTVNTK